MSSKPVIITMGLNADPLKRGLDGVTKQFRGLQASAQQMGHGTVSSMQAASASIRLLEGGITGNIRAAERFIGLIPGIGSALQAAFPIVGGLALAGVFVRIGMEAAKFVQKMNEIPANPFEGLISSAKLSNDQLAISNDRLAMEIAKLEHKPTNGMALALDQARESSDKLFESLTKANAAFAEANGKDNIGAFKGMWTGMAWTDTANKTIAHARSGVQAVTADHQPAIDDALESGNQENVKQAREALMVDLQKAYAQQDAELRAGLAYAQSRQKDHNSNFSSAADFSKVIEKYQSALAQSANEQKEAGGNYGQSVMQPKKDALDAAKANQEEAKRQQEAIVEQWREALRTDKANADVSVEQEASYWAYRAKTVKEGSLSYKAALDESNKEIARINAESMSTQKGTGKKYDEFGNISEESYNPGRMDLSKGDNGEMASQGRDTAAWLKSLDEGITLQNANAMAIANASLQMEVMTGRISALDAARVQQTMHEQEYQKAVEGVTAALAAAASLPEGAFKNKTISDLNNQRGQMDTTHTIQSAQDQQAISSQQIVPAMNQTLSVMGQQWSNMTSAIVQTMTRAIDSFNDDIAKAITGHGSKADFGKTFSAAGEGLVKASLQKGESGLMGALGLGKRDGSSEMSALWVQIKSAGAGAPAGMSTTNPAVSAGVSLTSLIPGGSFIQPFINSAMSLLPHFAAGGSFSAGQDFIAGEEGPELIHAGSGGNVTSNSRMGGDGGTHFHIDARGSNDPMAVQAAIMRAAPHIAASAVQATHSRASRAPRGR